MPSGNYVKHLPALVEEQDSKCHYCGTKIVLNNGKYSGTKYKGCWATVDHVVPRAMGGGNVVTNLVASCMACNGTKQHMEYKDYIYLLDCDNVIFNKFLQKNMIIRKKRSQVRRPGRIARRERNMLNLGLLLWWYFPEFAQLLLFESEKNIKAGLPYDQKKSVWEIKLKACRARRLDNNLTQLVDTSLSIPVFSVYSLFEFGQAV